jgi:4-amino-4-deoxy-L-arabinose transferase-like glycosyltransferase
VALLVRQALPDMPLALCISLTIWGAIEATSVGPIGAGATTAGRSAWSRRRWLILAAVAMALGMLTKGPIAVALPVVALTPLLLWERYSRADGTARAPFPLRMRDLAIALGVFLLVAAPWYIAVTRVHGLSFLKEFFLTENLDRFATEKFNARREPWFYVGVMAGGLLPWTAFGLLWIRPLTDLLARRRRLSTVAARLGAWALGPLLLLSASAGSQPRYILPCLIPVTILLARAVRQRVTDRSGRFDILFAGATAIAGATLLTFGALVLRAKPLLLAVNAEWTPAGALVMIGAGVTTLAAAVLAPRRLVPAVVALSAGATVMAFDATVLRADRPEPVEVIAAAIRREAPVTDICACGAFARNLSFYAQDKIFVGDFTEGDAVLRDFIQRSAPVLAASDEYWLGVVEAKLNRRFRRVAEVSYLNPDLWKRPDKALTDPDPAKYLKRVILVSNR